MKSEVKAKWIEALRSGKYKQGKGWLRQRRTGGDAFCCLGVLCDLHLRETNDKYGWDGWDMPGGRVVEVGTYHGWTTFPPEAVTTWAGLPDQNIEINNVSIEVYNDGNTPLLKPHSFAEIADLIEEHL